MIGFLWGGSRNGRSAEGADRGGMAVELVSAAVVVVRTWKLSSCG